MTTADKTLIIQDLQCRHKTWLEEFNNSLSLGKCVEKNHLDNITITNLIDVVYRYVPWDDTVTNAFTIDFGTANVPGCNRGWSITLSLQIGILDYTVTDFCGTDIITLLVDAINADGIYVADYDRVLTVYSVDPGETFITPTIDYFVTPLVGDPTYATGITVTTLTPEFVPATNCLTEDELCDVICRVRNLTTDCNC